MLRIAIALSAALHGALGMWVEVRDKAQPPVLREQMDAWSGPGIEVDSVPAAALAEPAAAAEPSEPNRSVDTHHTPARRATIRDKTPSVASTTATAAASTADTPSSTGAAFGAAGLPTGVRHLPKAFTRALGIASRGDKRWLTTRAGPVGEAHIELAVDEDGRLGELVYASEAESQRLAPVVRHLLANAQLLLASGRFSLDPSKVNAGVQRLRVRVEVTERVATADPNADPEHEYEAPTASRPGHGSFTLEGGRRVTSWVYLE